MTDLLESSSTRATAPLIRRGSAYGIGALIVAVLVAAALSLVVGSRTLSPSEVLDVLFSPDGSEASTIVHGLRVPRTLLGIVVGIALGTAGALMQGHTRNPLAEPGLLGVSSGASFAVVLGIFVFGITSAAGYTGFALLGAGLAALFVFSIGSTKGGPSPITLVLAGTAISALLTALTQAVVIRDSTTYEQYRFWVVGSTAGRDLDVLWQVLPFLGLGLVLAAISVPGLNLLQLGDDMAAALGMHPMRAKVIGISAVMLLAGGATAGCGPLYFVGLVVPHAARWLAGIDYRWVVPYSALLGALVVVLADTAGRVIARPGELQVGLMMALVGGPVFVMLVRNTKMVRL